MDQPRLTHKVILIADDEEGIRFAFANRSRKMGINPIEAKDGEAAIQALKTRKFDIATIDLTMPKKSGFQVIDAAKEIDPDLPLVVVTASELLDDVVKALRAKVSDYLVKPLEPLILFDMTIKRALRRADIVHENKRLYEENRRLAVTDALTSLFNRRRFDEMLEDEVERAMQFGRPLSLVLLDLDDLKQINDIHGHSMGDEALRLTAHAIRGALRNIDLPARIGGDEFAIILPECGQEGGHIVAEKLVAVVGNVQFQNIPLRVSAGLAYWQPSFTSPTDIFKAADEALYKAKAEGGNTVFVYE